MERSFQNAMEYIQDNNYVRAGEECEEALETAKKLKDKNKIEDISGYMMLIEAVNKADSLYGEQEYELAQADYMTARERSRNADHVADEYIEKKLSVINDYLSVYDYIQLGDSLSTKGDYKGAEEKYLWAKGLATRIYFDEGRKQAIEALDRLYEEMVKEQEEEEEENAPPAQTGRLATFRRFRAAALSVRFLFEGHAVCRFGFLFAETGRRGGVVWPRLGWGKGILVIPPFPSCQRDSSGLSLTILTPPPPCLPFPPCSIGRTDFIEKM